jgi:hypothetical protein
MTVRFQQHPHHPTEGPLAPKSPRLGARELHSCIRKAIRNGTWAILHIEEKALLKASLALAKVRCYLCSPQLLRAIEVILMKIRNLKLIRLGLRSINRAKEWRWKPPEWNAWIHEISFVEYLGLCAMERSRPTISAT